MEDYKERLVKEQSELKEKFLKLVKFINSEEFFKLSNNNKQVLKNQKIIMELYLSVLNMRIYEDIDNISNCYEKINANLLGTMFLFL